LRITADSVESMVNLQQRWQSTRQIVDYRYFYEHVLYRFSAAFRPLLWWCDARCWIHHWQTDCAVCNVHTTINSVGRSFTKRFKTVQASCCMFFLGHSDLGQVAIVKCVSVICIVAYLHIKLTSRQLVGYVTYQQANNNSA